MCHKITAFVWVAPTNVRLKFISEFMIESVEFLERMCNEKEPPMSLDDITTARLEFIVADGDDEGLRKRMKPMKLAFKERGDLSSWSPEVLKKIDDCFVKHYYMADNKLSPYFLFPDDPDSNNHFLLYCDDVDLILRTNEDNVPSFAREWFAYYSIYQMQDFAFPVPLGTASVVHALDTLLKVVRKGFVEVSHATCVGRRSTVRCKNSGSMRCAFAVWPVSQWDRRSTSFSYCKTSR